MGFSKATVALGRQNKKLLVNIIFKEDLYPCYALANKCFLMHEDMCVIKLILLTFTFW